MVRRVRVKGHKRKGRKVKAHSRKLPRVIRVSKHLTNVKNYDRKKDKRYKAMHAGERISKRGKKYREYRRNRADRNRTRRL